MSPCEHWDPNNETLLPTSAVEQKGGKPEHLPCPSLFAQHSMGSLAAGPRVQVLLYKDFYKIFQKGRKKGKLSYWVFFSFYKLYSFISHVRF